MGPLMEVLELLALPVLTDAAMAEAAEGEILMALAVQVPQEELLAEAVEAAGLELLPQAEQAAQGAQAQSEFIHGR